MIHYKEVVAAMNKNSTEDQIFDQLILSCNAVNAISLSEKSIQEEETWLYQDWLYRARYSELAGGEMVFLTPELIEEQMRQFHAQAIRNLKIDLILNEIIKEEQIEVMPQELKEEIQAIADREKMDSEQIRAFISESSLTHDLQIRKTIELLRSLAGRQT